MYSWTSLTTVAAVAACAGRPVSDSDRKPAAPSEFETLGLALRGWKCTCDASEHEAPCGEAGNDAGFVVEPQCWAWTSVPQLRGDRGLELAAEGRGPIPEFELDAKRADGLRAQSSPFRVESSPDGWRARTAPSSTVAVDRVRVFLSNDGGAPMHVQSVTASQNSANPPRPVGYLLSAEHYSELEIQPGPTTARVWLPLPIAHASQVPLWLDVQMHPPGVASAKFIAHDDTNWGIDFSFAPQVGVDEFAIRWRAVLLVREVLPHERSRVYAEPGKVDVWTERSIAADSEDRVVVEIAQGLAAGSQVPADQLRRVVGWTSAHLGDENAAAMTPEFEGLRVDASATIRRRAENTACTEFANVTTALGRALGLPTRQIAGYLVGESLLTHSLSEVYLGPDAGWRRVEPQRSDTAYPEAAFVAVRVVRPQDEGVQAMAPHRWAAPGVPMYVLIENLQGAERLQLRARTEHFEGCPKCDNHADLVATLEDEDSQRVDTALTEARHQWRAIRTALVEGGSLSGLMRSRRDMSQTRSVPQLQHALEAARPR